MSKAVTNAVTNSRYLNGQAVVYFKLDGVRYVIAKSVVKAVTDTDHLCGKDPYINSIRKLLQDDTILLPVSGKELISKVWDNPGNYKGVVFVKAESLINNLEDIFADVAPDELEAARKTMLTHLTQLP